MKITAFMTAFKFRKTEEEKEKMVDEHIKNEYVPYEKKADVAKAIVDSCFWQKETGDDGVERKTLHVDSVAKHMLSCMSIIDLYTDIERQKSGGKMLEDFNLLNSSGVLDMVIRKIDQREFKEFNMILQMTIDDLMTNEYENHAYITKQVDRFGALISTALSPIISEIDFDKIENLIAKFKE